MMEFLQAATCADQLEVLWRRMDDDADEEVDPTGMVLEIPDQQDAVLDQGNNESLNVGPALLGGVALKSIWRNYSGPPHCLRGPL